MGNKLPISEALNILSRRQVSTGQMQFMLSRKGFSSCGIKECINKLQEWGYLDDQALAENILDSMIRNVPYGKKRCYHELRKRRFDKDLAKALIYEVYSEIDERELAQTAAKHYVERKTKWTVKDKQRLARWLFRRGFSESTIWSVVRMFGQADDYE